MLCSFDLNFFFVKVLIDEYMGDCFYFIEITMITITIENEIKKIKFHTENKQVSHWRKRNGRTLSQVSTSLPSRLSMRPLGVVSKYDITPRITCFKAISKICFEARTDPIAMVKDTEKMEIAKSTGCINNKKIKKIKGYNTY